MRQYEGILIYAPDLTPEKIDELKKEFQGQVEKHGGKVSQSQDMGKRSFGYQVKKHTQGTYICYSFELNPDQMTSFKRSITLIQHILRANFFSLANKKSSQLRSSVSQAHPAVQPAQPQPAQRKI